MLISNRLEMGTINSLFKIISLFRRLLADFARLHQNLCGNDSIKEIESSEEQERKEIIMGSQE
jgi:hypothetical protein